jgi:hypothetical protein
MKKVIAPLLAAAAMLPAVCHAQASATKDVARPYSAFLFAWGPSLDADLRVTDPRNGAPVDFSARAKAGNLIENLDSAFMAYVDRTAGDWSVFGDWSYTKLSPSAELNPASGISRVDTSLKSQFGELAASYRFAGERDTRIEAYGGVRYYDLKNVVTLRTVAGDVGARERDDFVDAVAGVRARWQPAPGWSAVAQADFGAGGTERSWQGWAYLGYQFDWGSVGLGWRYLRFVREHGGASSDLAFNGPLAGLVARF